ncbi:hypothetical protein PoB_005935300 [Plakobranchus ocellatus]|uniref:Uncharacterized protein n=1 Tax=Plakobranchus ocellatus TaxID=259542 RepID=A0AAV4CN20_9GAST|nr:hypothetical protein PoB_005935300 [Plakobranchus ocellatus]
MACLLISMNRREDVRKRPKDNPLALYFATRTMRTCLLRSPGLVPGFPAGFHDDGIPVKDEEFLGNLPGCDNEDLPGTSWKRALMH